MISFIIGAYIFGTIMISGLGTAIVFQPHSEFDITVKDWIRFCIAWPVIIVMWLLSKD